MKKFLFIGILVMMMTDICFSSNDIDLDSKITSAIVYPQWAYVTRTADVTLTKGLSRLYLKNLPPWIDSNSIQVNISNFEGNRIIGATTESVFSAEIEEQDIKDVRDKIKSLNEKLEDYDSDINTLLKEREYLNGLTVWGREYANDEKQNGKMNLEEIKAFNSYVKTSISENFKNEIGIKRKISEVNSELALYNKKWAESQSKVNIEHKQIMIDLETKGGTYRVNVSYLISGASWYPVYDVRIDRDNKNLDVEYYAMIQQTTGEDWQDAKFKLSTIKPYLVREKPELAPWYVNLGNINQTNFSRTENEDYKKDLNDIQEQQKTFFSKSKNRSGYENYSKNSVDIDEVVRQVEERGTTVEFMIEGTYSVKSDGNQIKMAVDKFSLNAEKKFSSAPAISKSTYVSGSIKNTSNKPILPGVISVYRNGNFIGKSKIGFISDKEKFDLFMGLEDRIKVTRDIDVKKSMTTITGNTSRMKIGYTIELQNFTSESVVIDVSDQIPVSQNSSIKVRMNTNDPKPDRIDKGVLTWKVSMAANEKKTIYFEFEMEYPTEANLNNFKELKKQIDNMY
jgi:uncharacterized protein (TIGR02231 family)